MQTVEQIYTEVDKHSRTHIPWKHKLQSNHEEF